MKRMTWFTFMAIVCFSVSGLAESWAGDWYDFGGGKINLANVKFIAPKISLAYHPAINQKTRMMLDQFDQLQKAQLEREGGVPAMLKTLKAQGVEALKKMVDEKCLGVAFGKWTNPLTKKDVDIVIEALKKADPSCYQGVQVTAYVMFDDFKVTFYEFYKKEGLTKADIGQVKDGLKKALKQYQSVD